VKGLTRERKIRLTGDVFTFKMSLKNQVNAFAAQIQDVKLFER